MRPLVRRRLVCLGSLVTLAASLAGCGFRPVYMPTASGKAGVAQRELSTVFVEIIPERPGQILRQALQERFGNDSGTPASYNLHVAFGVSGEGIAIEANSIATRVRLVGNATWTLIGHDDKHTKLTSGSARAIDAFNIFDSQYFASDLEIEADEKRMAENLATQITTQLAVWFHERAEKPPQQAEKG
jgi:LPS-assembly lipoprotein